MEIWKRMVYCKQVEYYIAGNIVNKIRNLGFGMMEYGMEILS